MKAFYQLNIVCRIAFAAITIFTVAFFVLHLSTNKIRINTDLKSLSPRMSADPQLQQAINTLSSSIEQRFILMFEAEDEYTLDTLVEAFSSALDENENMHVINYAEWLTDDMVPALRAHRFQLLDEQQRQHILAQSSPSLIQEGKQKIYGFAGGLKLLPVDEDPFGFFSDYVLNALSRLGNEDAEETQEIEKDGVVFYTQALIVKLKGGALALDQQNQIQKSINQLANVLREQDLNFNVYHSGVFFFAVDAASKSKKDIGLISSISLAGTLLIFLLAFSSLRPMLLPLASIAMGIGFAFACIHSIFGGVHVLTIVFGASLIGVVIDYSLHYFYHQKAGSQQTHLQSALFLSLCTSLIGYAALSFSALTSLQQVALFSCLGLAAAWLSVIVLGPLIRGQNFKVNTLFVNFLFALVSRPLVRFIFPLRKFLPAFIFLLAALFLWRGIETGDSPREIFRPSEQLLKEEAFVSSQLSDYEPGKYLALSDNSQEALLNKLASLYEKHRTIDFDNTLSVLHWIPDSAAQAENYRALEKLYTPAYGDAENSDPGTSSTVRQLLSSLNVTPAVISKQENAFREASGLPINPEVLFKPEGSPLLELWLNFDSRFYTFILLRKGSDWQAFENIAANEAGLTFIDVASLSTEVLHSQRVSSTWLLVVAYLLVGMLVLFRYRSLNSLNILLVPICATTLSVIVLAVFSVPISLFHVMAMFLVLGLGMDYVIFVREMPLDSHETMMAVVLSAITSLLAFGLLSISALPVVSAFGQTVLLGNTFNLLGAILLRQSLTIKGS